MVSVLGMEQDMENESQAWDFHSIVTFWGLGGFQSEGFGKCSLLNFFSRCFGRFSSCRNGRERSSSSCGKEEKQSWGGKRKQKQGRKNRDYIFHFFFKWEIRTLLTFPIFPTKPFVLGAAQARLGQFSPGPSTSMAKRLRR